MQYNEDANKRTCSLPTRCLPTPGRISDTQPVIPMERKGTSEQRVHAATRPHTAVLSLWARSQVWVFLFFFQLLFSRKTYSEINISSWYTHLLYNYRSPKSINRDNGIWHRRKSRRGHYRCNRKTCFLKMYQIWHKNCFTCTLNISVKIIKCSFPNDVPVNNPYNFVKKNYLTGLWIEYCISKENTMCTPSYKQVYMLNTL